MTIHVMVTFKGLEYLMNTSYTVITTVTQSSLINRTFEMCKIILNHSCKHMREIILIVLLLLADSVYTRHPIPLSLQTLLCWQ